jgi:hypothetical protein
MGTKFDSINEKHKKFIEKQKMFVVGSASPTGHMSVSPKGMDAFKILDENHIVWMNFSGSTNETSAHIQEDNRMTILFNSFDKNPLILKLYGTAEVIHNKDPQWDELKSHFKNIFGIRQFFKMEVELVLTSCGYGVPMYDYIGERNLIEKWAEKKGEEGMRDYWIKNNTKTINGKDTNLMELSK